MASLKITLLTAFMSHEGLDAQVCLKAMREHTGLAALACGGGMGWMRCGLCVYMVELAKMA